MAFDRFAYDREQQQKRRDERRAISEPPEVTNKAARKACDKSLWTYGITIYGDTFPVKPCRDHKNLADQIQIAIDEGTKRAIAVERGFGKTTWCSIAVEWATLTGRAEMAMIISGNDSEADNLSQGILTNFETRDPLYELYPEMIHFFRETAQHGPQLKATFRGEPIRLKRRPDIIFPCVPFIAAEACIRCAGIDSKGVRGSHHVRADGHRARPTVVLLDDPQDDDLARSSNEVAKRESKIKKTIHGLGPPGRTLTVLMPCTPIEQGDLAERFLDRKRTPEYQGIKWPALISWPDCWNDPDGNLWERYFQILAEDQADGIDDHRNATKFYLENRDAMSAGANVRWTQRVDNNCIDALQSLMNKYAEGPAAFMSERMMEPEAEAAVSTYLNQDQIAGRFNRLERRYIPESVSRITVAIDVQQRLFYWLMVGWSDDKKGFILDYDTFPKQPRSGFTHLNAPNTIEQFVKARIESGLTWEESLKVCLRLLVDDLRGAIPSESGDRFADLILIDNRWQQARTPIFEVAAEKDFADILQPAGGLYVGPGDIPISERKRVQGQQKFGTDVEWYYKREAGFPPILLFDANHYRSEFQRGLAAEPATPGSITFFGRIPNATLAEHFAAKAVFIQDGSKRRIEDWKNKVGRNQDHWLDCAVMNVVALEVLGFRTGGKTGKNAKREVGTSRRGRKRITAETIKQWGKRV